VSWFRNGLLLEKDHNVEKRSDKADGAVLRLDAEKGLEGLYSCSAENELGRDEFYKTFFCLNLQHFCTIS
jgi:hypothetical protein